jgi:hypothetical protein
MQHAPDASRSSGALTFDWKSGEHTQAYDNDSIATETAHPLLQQMTKTLVFTLVNGKW